MDLLLLFSLREGRPAPSGSTKMALQGRSNEGAGQGVHLKQSGIFEGPEVGFYSRVADVIAFERSMHEKLKTRGLRASGAGVEWFETNLVEVRRAFREVRWPGPVSLPRRLVAALGMALANRA